MTRPVGGRPDGRHAALAGSTATAAVAAALFPQFIVARALLRILALVAVLAVALQPPLRRYGLRVPLALAAFVAWACASYLWTADPWVSRRRLADLVAVAVVGWCCGSLLTYQDLHRLLVRLFRAIVVVTFVALVLAPGWSTRPSADGIPGWHALFAHKNGLGAFAVVAVATFAFDARGGQARWLWVTAAAVLVVGSGSATALGLGLLLLALLVWSRVLRPERPPLSRTALALGGYLSALAGAIVVVTQFDVVTSILGRGETLTGRTEVWRHIWAVSQHRPLGGYGLGGVWESPLAPTSEIWKAVRFRAFHAHSGYLEIVLQLGLVGLYLFTVLVGTAAGRAWRARVEHPGARWAVTVLALLAVNGLVESAPFFGFGFLLIALLATIGAQERRSPDSWGATTPTYLRSSSSSW